MKTYFHHVILGVHKKNTWHMRILYGCEQLFGRSVPTGSLRCSCRLPLGRWCLRPCDTAIWWRTGSAAQECCVDRDCAAVGGGDLLLRNFDGNPLSLCNKKRSLRIFFWNRNEKTMFWDGNSQSGHFAGLHRYTESILDFRDALQLFRVRCAIV